MATFAKRIFTDLGSIYAEFCRTHPDLNVGEVHHNNSTSGPLAWVSVMDDCTEGKEITVQRDDERWSYFGFEIGIIRWTDAREGGKP